MGIVVQLARAVQETFSGVWTSRERTALQASFKGQSADGRYKHLSETVGVTELGDPWYALTDPLTGQTEVHVARISGRYLFCLGAGGELVEGIDLTQLLRRSLSGQVGQVANWTAMMILATAGFDAVAAEFADGFSRGNDWPVPDGSTVQEVAEVLLTLEAQKIASALEVDVAGLPGSEQPDYFWLGFTAFAAAEEPKAEQGAATSTAGMIPQMSVAWSSSDFAAPPPDDEVPVLVFTGTAGSDTLIGTYADDVLLGGAGDDLLRGQAGDDLLEGGSGNDTLEGDEGDDTLVGGSGADLLIGGDGADVLVFGPDDIATGGDGHDRFDYQPDVTKPSRSLVTDFDTQVDTLRYQRNTGEYEVVQMTSTTERIRLDVDDDGLFDLVLAFEVDPTGRPLRKLILETLTVKVLNSNEQDLVDANVFDTLTSVSKIDNLIEAQIGKEVPLSLAHTIVQEALELLEQTRPVATDWMM